LTAVAGRSSVLAEVMFSLPFTDFDPGPQEPAAGAAVREFVVGQVRRCIAAGRLAGDATDITHVLVALVQGLTTQESAGWLGSSSESAVPRSRPVPRCPALTWITPVPYIAPNRFRQVGHHDWCAGWRAIAQRRDARHRRDR
jgi:hypothetical protein